jgi:hypothetical protein
VGLAAINPGMIVAGSAEEGYYMDSLNHDAPGVGVGMVTGGGRAGGGRGGGHAATAGHA